MTKAETIENLERAVGSVLAKARTITPDSIRVLIGQMRTLPSFEATPEEAESLARRLEVIHDVTMSLGSVLKAPGFKPWLEKALTSGLTPYYWNRYRSLLVEKHF